MSDNNNPDSQIHLKDTSGDRKYYTTTPQLVWALSENCDMYTLWDVIKMIAGEAGECYLNNSDLAALAMQAKATMIKNRTRLLELKLLEGELRYHDEKSNNKVWHLSIPDIWEANMVWRKTIHSLKERVEMKRQQKSRLRGGSSKTTPEEEPS